MTGCRCVRPGRDLTLLLHAATRGRCDAAAQALSRLGIEAELIEIDPAAAPAGAERLLIESLRRTGRLACVTAAGPDAMAAAHLAAHAAQEAAVALVRPVLRVVLPAEPLPPEHLLQPLVQLVAGPRAAEPPPKPARPCAGAG